MIKYYTKAWQDECLRRMSADASFEQDAKKLNGTFVFRVYDCPDGQDRTMHWTFKQGKCTDSKYEAHPAPWEELRNSQFNPTWVMRGSCPYNMMAALNKGEMTPMRALASPHYKLEGNKMSIMQLMKPLSQWNQLCASVESVYDWTAEDAAAADSSVPVNAESSENTETVAQEGGQ
jgi:putative sterol carrier protein